MTIASARCQRCNWIIRVNLDAEGKPDRVLCPGCQAEADARGADKEYPIIPVEELPPNQLCAYCQQRNGPERAEAMYHHNDGPVGTHWYAHCSCEIQKAYDEVEHQRDTRDWDDERPM